MRSWVEPPDEIRPADWWEVATYIVLVLLMLGLMAHEERAASEDTARNTDVTASVVEERP